MYIAPLRPKTQRRFEDKQLNQARSKPDTVNRPVRTAHILCTIIIVHNTVTQTVFIYIPLPPDQHHISDVATIIHYFRQLRVDGLISVCVSLLSHRDTEISATSRPAVYATIIHYFRQLRVDGLISVCVSFITS